METTMVDWSSLPRDLLVSIAKLTMMISVEDFMAFRSTCSSWNEAAGDDECVKAFRWPRAPFLLIPEKAEFYSLSRKKSYFLRTPLPEGKSMKFIGSRFEWILTLETSGNTNLFHPISKTWIQLPNYKTLPQTSNCQFITRSVLSANPSQTSDYVVVVLTQVGFMAFWRPGNQNWTRINESMSSSGFVTDIIFYSMVRKFYAVNIWPNVQIWSWDMNNDFAVRVTVKEPKTLGRYLVESSAGELLVFGMINDPLTDLGPNVQVHRLDFINGVWERMISFKDAIFLGSGSASFSIVPDDDDPVIRSNCVYFYDHPTKKMGVYNLEDRSFQRLPTQLDRASSFSSLPVWISPSSLSFMASLGHGSGVPDPQPYLMKLVKFVSTHFYRLWFGCSKRLIN